MKKKHFLVGSIKHFPSLFMMGTFFLSAVLGAGSFGAEKMLLKSHFDDLKNNWQVWDDPAGDTSFKSSQWRAGLAELSGISNKSQKVATMLLAGEISWRNYTVETTLLNDTLPGIPDRDHLRLPGRGAFLSCRL